MDPLLHIKSGKDDVACTVHLASIIPKLFQALSAGEELFSKYDVAFNRDGLKSALKAALDFGHLISGRSRKDFANFVRPYLQVASKAAENFNTAEYVNFAFENN